MRTEKTVLRNKVNKFYDYGRFLCDRNKEIEIEFNKSTRQYGYLSTMPDWNKFAYNFYLTNRF